MTGLTALILMTLALPPLLARRSRFGAKAWLAQTDQPPMEQDIETYQE